MSRIFLPPDFIQTKQIQDLSAYDRLQIPDTETY